MAPFKSKWDVKPTVNVHESLTGVWHLFELFPWGRLTYRDPRTMTHRYASAFVSASFCFLIDYPSSQDLILGQDGAFVLVKSFIVPSFPGRMVPLNDLMRHPQLQPRRSLAPIFPKHPLRILATAYREHIFWSPGLL